jgi:two-component system, chemotaxis family, sensor histidine kinase and response regulator PixL
MAINPDIRDQAYQFFVEEAPELLQDLESGLLTLTQDHSTAKIHSLMRAAHTIKGGAASVGLEPIATLAHRLETILKALYSDDLIIDTDLENQLLQAYDCLQLPLMQQITTGGFDAEYALAIADPIFMQLETRCGEALAQTDAYIPSSAELGVNMVAAIFEVDVVQGLEFLSSVVTNAETSEVAGALRAQMEVFAGFAELLNLPEFATIAATVQDALSAHPDRALEITRLALIDFERYRQAVLAGQTRNVGMSEALLNLANGNPDFIDLSQTQQDAIARTESLFNDEIGDEDENLDDFNFSLVESIFGKEIAISLTEPDLDVDDFDIDRALNIDLDFDLNSNSGIDLNTDISSDVSSDIDIDVNVDRDVSVNVNATRDTDINDDVKSYAAINTDFALDPEVEVNFNVEIGSELNAEIDAEIDTEINVSPGFVSIANSDLDSYSTDSTHVVDPDDGAIETTHYFTFTDPAATQSQFLEEDAAIRIESELVDETQSWADSNSFSNTTIETTATAAIETDHLPNLSIYAETSSLVPSQSSSSNAIQVSEPLGLAITHNPTDANRGQRDEPITPNLTVRVDSDRLDRINSIVGELAISHNSLFLQNEQLQGTIRELLNRFSRFQTQASQLRQLSDQMLVAPERYGSNLETSMRRGNGTPEAPGSSNPQFYTSSYQAAAPSPAVEFDSLEMDSYSALHFQLQGIIEELVQLEEAVDDIAFYARQSNQTLHQQRPMLTRLQDEVTWSRMVPIAEVLNRFPRMLRDLSATYHKPVTLDLVGTEVLIDKAILEKLYDPLLHIIRNAFDHGIEAPHIRQHRGKPEQGKIEIQTYHRGNQTVIEVKDDGQGLNLDRIRGRVFELGWLTTEQLSAATPAQLFEFIFEPGFSTAHQVSKLSGRGVGLDVVRSQLQSIKGSVTVESFPGKGTTFTLRLPLMLTIAKLVICSASSATVALSIDSLAEILTPKSDQTKQSGAQRFLYWQQQIIPVYRIADLLDYRCPLPETASKKVLASVASPQDWAPPMLVFRKDQQVFALEVDQVLTEQELIIKPFSQTIAAPHYTYGCTILADGSLVPVIDTIALLSSEFAPPAAKPQDANDVNLTQNHSLGYHPPARAALGQAATAIQAPVKTPVKMVKAPTILVVDDAATLRRSLALSLEREGFRVLQARDGREAIDQLQQRSSIQLVVCDIEMPNMNGFEFLNYRRQDPNLSKIPVVILTSRSNEKHRWLAMQLGATAYFTKPYLEQVFLEAIADLTEIR